MSASPPSPPLVPKAGERRFKNMTTACEWIETYYPGSYHPVHIGDVFNNGQYEVLRKLGYGSSSTVWLARDQRNNRYVALKVLVSDNAASTTELQMLHHIANVAAAEGARHITQLLDEFEHHGPNGTHKCLVFELMGPNMNAMVERMPQFRIRKPGIKIRYPPRMAKSILKQTLQALAFLHGNSIAHGDLQPGNILFALDSIDATPVDELRQKTDVPNRYISAPVERLDGKQDRWAPRYLCVAKPLAAYTKYEQSFRIKLTDMGGAYFFTDPPAKPVTPRGLRAPELIFNGAVNHTLDIWSFGCLVFELLTGRPRFCIPWFDGWEDDNHLLDLTAHIGPLPDELFAQWKTSSLYFTPERTLFNCHLGGFSEEEGPLMEEEQSMEDVFDEAAPEIDEAEARTVKELVRRILQYDPAKRPSAAELLADPWFRRIEV